MFKRVKKRIKHQQNSFCTNINYDIKIFKHENIPGNAKFFKN